MKDKNVFKDEKLNISNNNLSILKSSIDNSPNLTLDKEIIYNVHELVQESFKNMEYVGETIESRARELLSYYGFKIQIRNFYAYLMREIMRNVVEHSEAEEFKVTLYSNDFNEFAFKVVDNGIGIRKSLNSNPLYNLADDLTALAFCVKPGITRSHKRDPYRDDVWQNSGFGLHMVSYIISEIGKFEIFSGNTKLMIKKGFMEAKKGKIKGTEVTVIINSNIKINIPETIKNASIIGNQIAESSYHYAEFAKIKTASKASTLLK